ncbi:hypothetical protein ACYCJX_03735 [Staphylococcus borealis]|uniref:hypothetical protein n=1 Tax=Staphylococcus borealis TaxID=2742203 RepID=UPI003DA772F0
MKKVLFTLLLSLVLLAGCSFSNQDKENDHSKSKTTSQDNKDNDKEKDNQQSSAKSSNKDAQSDHPSTQQSNDDNSSNKQDTKQIDVQNITDRATLETVIYSNNYTEIEKIAAYNSAVANGVIPQGNVMEGPASAAYESSLRVERGQEKSIYDQSNQTSETDDIDDPNAEINAATNEDEYVDALRKKYNGGLSSGELQTKHAIEEGYYDGDDADEVYETIQQREQDIANGKYDKYKRN